MNARSQVMFFCSIGGNWSYALAILLRMRPGPSFWETTFPYLLSCLITIGCDLIIVMQARWYRTQGAQARLNGDAQSKPVIRVAGEDSLTDTDQESCAGEA